MVTCQFIKNCYIPNIIQLNLFGLQAMRLYIEEAWVIIPNAILHSFTIIIGPNNTILK